jgi:hypothetical protein
VATEQIEITPLPGLIESDQDAEDLASAAGFRQEQLRTLAARCEKLGFSVEAQRWQELADGLVAEFVEPWKVGVRPTVYPHHLEHLRHGLDALIAALSNEKLHDKLERLGGRRYAGWRKALKEHATYLTEWLLPRLQEQRSLPFPPSVEQVGVLGEGAE